MKQPHIHKTLIDQWSAAPWAWNVLLMPANYGSWIVCPISELYWRENYKYKLDPSPEHPSYEVWKEYTANPEWWGVCNSDRSIATPQWLLTETYTLHKSDKHPDNIKPKKKLLDWEAMPRGTMTNKGELLSADNRIGRAHILRKDFGISWTMRVLRLAEKTEFTYWGGGECPVPEGVIVEYVMRCGDCFDDIGAKLIWSRDECPVPGDIIAYRIIKLAPDFTDNPEESV